MGMDSAMKWVGIMMLLSTALVVTNAQVKGGPIPAANLPTQCNNFQKCCMPTPYTGAPMYEFQYESNLPVKTRPAAHLVDETYVAKIERAYALMRALPDSDPRSLLNQMRLHCLYCNNALYYPGIKYPLAIHNGWLFLPWHRMFIYFHERILQTLLEDETFALPYWAWDISLDVKPVPNTMPAMYAKVNSSLYDEYRNNCSFPPFLVDLDTITGCTAKSPDFIRIQNDRLMYTQIVVGAPTTSLFYGQPYRFGDIGGMGPGTFEDKPHGTVHAWVGDPNAPPPRTPSDDMGNFSRAAYDPIFYAHHGNVDRLWEVWRTLPGRSGQWPTDPVFLDSEFTFYDQNARLVKAKVSQFLDIEKLRYNYQPLSTPWVTNGVVAGQENSIPTCAGRLTPTAVDAMIAATPKHKSSDILGATPLTFKVTRGTRRSEGTEVLEIAGLHLPNQDGQVHWNAFFFFPNATFMNGPACPEFAGTFNFIPVVGQSTKNPKRLWRAVVGPKLKQIGLDYVKEVVVTVVQAGLVQNVTFENAKIFYDLSPAKTL